MKIVSRSLLIALLLLSQAKASSELESQEQNSFKDEFSRDELIAYAAISAAFTVVGIGVYKWWPRKESSDLKGRQANNGSKALQELPTPIDVSFTKLTSEQTQELFDANPCGLLYSDPLGDSLPVVIKTQNDLPDSFYIGYCRNGLSLSFYLISSTDKSKWIPLYEELQIPRSLMDSEPRKQTGPSCAQSLPEPIVVQPQSESDENWIQLTEKQIDDVFEKNPEGFIILENGRSHCKSRDDLSSRKLSLWYSQIPSFRTELSTRKHGRSNVHPVNLNSIVIPAELLPTVVGLGYLRAIALLKSNPGLCFKKDGEKLKISALESLASQSECIKYNRATGKFFVGESIGAMSGRELALENGADILIPDTIKPVLGVLPVSQ